MAFLMMMCRSRALDALRSRDQAVLHEDPASLIDDASTSAMLTTLGLDTDLQTFALPASTTISATGASLIDDASTSAMLTTLGVDTDLRLSPCLRFGGFLHFCHAHRFLRLIPKYPDCVIQPWSIPYARR
jgi:hypothetical protein